MPSGAKSPDSMCRSWPCCADSGTNRAHILVKSGQTHTAPVRKSHPWAARYDTWLLIALTPEGFSFLFFPFLFFSFLFFSFLFFPFLFFSFLFFSFLFFSFLSFPFLFFSFPGKAHPEVGLDYVGAPHFQLPSGFAIPRHLIALIIHNAHVCEQVWPALAHPVLHLFFFV